MIMTVIIIVLYVCVFIGLLLYCMCVYFYCRLDERLTSIMRLCAQECTCIVYIEGVYHDSDGDCCCIVCVCIFLQVG